MAIAGTPDWTEHVRRYPELIGQVWESLNRSPKLLPVTDGIMRRGVAFWRSNEAQLEFNRRKRDGAFLAWLGLVKASEAHTRAMLREEVNPEVLALYMAYEMLPGPRTLTNRRRLAREIARVKRRLKHQERTHARR